jgi:hypothetical protein
VRRFSLALGLGLGLGSVAGVVIGWLIPVSPVEVGFDRLHPDFQADYAVMVGAAYAQDGDWDLAEARLGALNLPDPAAYVAEQAEIYIAEGRNPDDIRSLVLLAARFGYVTPVMQPYLPADESEPPDE